jgi:hypothetical protein
VHQTVVAENNMEELVAIVTFDTAATVKAKRHKTCITTSYIFAVLHYLIPPNSSHRRYHNTLHGSYGG